MSDYRLVGFCLVHQLDVHIDDDRRCVTDKSLTIPPSFGNRNQQWRDGNWRPEKAKPEGYVYKPPVFATPTPAFKATEAPTRCGHCGAALVIQTGGGVPRGYCDATCKNRANNKLRNARQKALNAARPPVTRTCEHCGTTFSRPPGTPQKFCATACQIKAKNARRKKVAG